MNLGQILILFTTAATAAAMLAYLPGVRRSEGKPLLQLARPMVFLSTLGLVACSVLLWQLILTHQYQYDYVFRYTSSDMQLRYVFAAFWGGQEGTFLLWALFGGLLAVFLRFKAKQYEAPVLFFYLGINLFLLFMMIKASPFKMLLGQDGMPVQPVEGNGLNPLLQDPWMTIHPPIMFFGFASLGIPAAYAMAALVKEDWDAWVRRSIPWTIFGVAALGTGLLLGGYWAYSILGWGGFWGWDPVENSSLVPWLIAVGLLHTLVIQQKRGIFRRLNLFLSLLPFVLVTYSTFLTRSGVLADFSVHSFTDLGINQFLVAFMVVFLGGGLLLFVFKFRRIPVDKAQAPFWSREYFMFLGSLAFCLLGLFVLLGTSAPILTRLWGPPANVQPEFYNRMSQPFAVAIGLLIALGPMLMWNRVDLRGLLIKVRWPALATALFTPVLIWAGVREWNHLLILVAAVFGVLANLQIVIQIMRHNRLAAGGYVTHVGIGFALLGIVASTVYSTEETVVLPKGEEVMSLGYGFTYLGNRPVEEGRKDAHDVTLRTASGSYVMSPTMFFSDFNRGMMKKPAIQMFWVRDVYLSPIGVASDPLDERIQTRIVLEKDKPVEMFNQTLTLRGYETRTAHHEGHGHEVEEVVARLEVETPEGAVVVEPVLVVHAEGKPDFIPALIPGTGQRVSLLGLDGDNVVAHMAVGKAPVVLGRGEQVDLPTGSLALSGFDVQMPTKQGGSVKVFADTHVEMAGQSFHVRPGFVSRPGAEELELIEAPIGRTGMNLVLQSVNSDDGTGMFHIAPTPQEYLYAEASLKPFIGLLWLGTAVCLIGLTMATLYRARLAGRLSAAEAGDKKGKKTVKKNGKREAA